ncbi:HAD family hydrolase [Bradyrhizobium erythrophlei]|uniref:HAD family hydrolase n=1 Tax=Bradyrhizobium erythrophlei TaxID=1437360 RepID=UPI000B80D7C8|nr:HAD hydrolase-like protein [Bradyrhizobium erythrophlei]
MIFSGFIFDIEGTLVDCVPHTLNSLQEALKMRGHAVSYETLQLCSGLDGDETLKLVTPSFKENERKQMLKDAGKYYEQTYLPLVRPFEGVRALFTAIKQAGGAIAFATDCKGAPLKVYRGSPASTTLSIISLAAMIFPRASPIPR